MSAGGVDDLVARVVRDGHRVLSQTSHADGRNYYHIQMGAGLFTVSNLADYERILSMRVEPEPDQLSLFGEVV